MRSVWVMIMVTMGSERTVASGVARREANQRCTSTPVMSAICVPANRDKICRRRGFWYTYSAYCFDTRA